MIRILFLIAVAALLLNSCVEDNEKDLFPRPVLSDSAFQGLLGWYSLDSGLLDITGRLDPLYPFGNPEWIAGYNGLDSAALSLDGVDDYLRVLIGHHDSLAISMWILPFPSLRHSMLFDYGAGSFAAGLDAITTATMPRYRLFMKQDTAVHYFEDEYDFFYWTYLYIELGDTLLPPRLYINGYAPLADTISWTMRPLIDILYLGRQYNPYEMDSTMFRGYIDDIRIFNQFLTEEEILSIYWDGLSKKRSR